jgi:acetyltransferase-like isoleucine patch superfamily enzyme
MSLKKFFDNSQQNMMRKYQDFFVGSVKFSDLIRYEIITSCLTAAPGALGLYLRKIFFPKLFKSKGRNMLFGKYMTIRHPSKIQLGNDVVFEDNCVLDAKGTDLAQIIIGDEVLLSRNTIIRTRQNTLNIGRQSNIGANCIIASDCLESPVRIGENVLIAAYCYILGGGNYSYSDLQTPVMYQDKFSRGGITIEDKVWLGAGVKILDGVKIGKGAVIGAGAVVTKNIPEFSIAVGVPARVVGKRSDGAT